MHAATERLPDISRAELQEVSAHLDPAIEAINGALAAHRRGHVAVMCHSLLTSCLSPDERGHVLAYLKRMVRSDLN
jgi:hypothetical protein